MAEAVGLAILTGLGSASSAGTAIVGSLTIAQAVGTVAIGGALLGAQTLLGSLGAKPRRAEQQQAVLNEAMGPRRRIYGRAMVGGTRAFWAARNGQLYQAIMVASDRIDGFQEYWIGKTPVTTSGGENGGNVLTAPMAGKLFIEPHLGAANQAASPTLLSDFGDVWTANHRLLGIAYAVVVFQGVKAEEFGKVYPSGAGTQIRFVVRGARCWNPADPGQDPDNWNTWSFSDNAGDCILDYLRHPDGMRFDLGRRIDVPAFVDFHAVCEELIARRDGTLEQRYRIGGAYDFSQAPKDVLAKMCGTCDAELVQGRSGKIGIRGGKWRAPSVTISTPHIVTSNLSQGSGRLNAYNRLKITYTDPDNYYEPTPINAREDLPSQARVGVIDETIDLDMVPSWTQAARLGKLRMAKDNPDWKGTIGTHLAAIEALAEPTFAVQYNPVPEIGAIVDEIFYPSSFNIRGDLSGCDIGIASISEAAFSWDPDAEEPPRPITPQVIPQIDQVDPPTITGADVANGAGSLTWSAPSRADALPDAQWKPSAAGGDSWLSMTIRPGGLGADVSGLAPGVTYVFRVRFVVGNVGSDWSQTGPLP